MARKEKLAGYLRALKLMSLVNPNTNKHYTQLEACNTAGLSRMTFNKYRELMGDTLLSETTIELPVKKEVAKPTVSEIDRILQENNALDEQLKLRQE